MQRIGDTDEGQIIRAQVEQPPAGETPLHAFMRLFWDIVDPHPFVDGRHLHAKTEVLTAMHRGQLRDVIINEPPGSCKTLLCSVFWPAFIWLNVRPTERMLFAAYDGQLLTRDSIRFTQLLAHPKVAAAYPDFSMGKDVQAAQWVKNGHHGDRVSRTPGGNVTGLHFHGHVYDDLLNPVHITQGVSGEHQIALQKANNWVQNVANSRAIDKDKLWRLVIAQRLHEIDPSGVLLSTGDWEHLCFPEEYVPDAKWIVGDLTTKHEFRKLPGQLLWPERRGKASAARTKKGFENKASYSAQYDQNPTPASGGILSKKDFRLHAYKILPPLERCQIVASLDLAFKKEAERSRCGFQLWARFEEDDYLIAGEAAHMSYAESKARVKELYTDPLWGQAGTWLVEDKANGTALVSDLEEDFPKIVAYEPGSTNKVERMLPHVESVRRGQTKLPDWKIWPWAEEVVDEICKVPRGQYDEHWDCMSQAKSYLRSGQLNYSAALKGFMSLGV